jgi:oligopeptide/dipeptide ABC transporter ATP-binding protein
MTSLPARSDSLRPTDASPLPGAYDPLLRVEGLRKVFASGRGDSGAAKSPTTKGPIFAAVDGVDLTASSGEAVGIVGESGSGKTTVARCVLRLTEPSAGSVYFEGAPVSQFSGQALHAFRRRAQIVFQDPFASLDPRFSVRRTIAEPLKVHRICPRAEMNDRAAQLMRQVGLRADMLERHRHELSGGEAQRVTIARALATSPQFLILDEPTSALDASARLRVITLLQELRSSLGMTYLVISHDLNTISRLCHRVLVMYRGRVVEEGPALSILGDPRHPYTRALVAALPVASSTRVQKRARLRPAVDALPSEYGCALSARCPYATEECPVTLQKITEISPSHRVACHRVARGELVFDDVPVQSVGNTGEKS